jgi:hypothetical protein
MKKINLNLKERFLQFYRNQNIIAKILFVPFALAAVGMLVTLLHPTFVYTTFLLGLLWFVSRLIPRREKREGKGNAFTLPVVLCAALSLILFVGSAFYTPAPPQESERLNWECELLQDNLNESNKSPEEIVDIIRHNLKIGNTLYDVNHNYVITDRENNVLYAKTSWRTGVEEKLSALISPFPITVGGGYHLMLLVNERGDVVSTFRVSRDWMTVNSGNPYSALTLSDGQPAESADPIYDRYFPSFGSVLDSCLFSLSDGVLEYGYEGREIHIADWNGQTVADISQTPMTMTTRRQAVAELNALTEEERNALKKYIAWVDQACDSIYPDVNPNNASEARILTSSDGELTLYILYEYDYDALNPRMASYISKIQVRNYVLMVSYLLIPVVIVLLAFWVFVDATRRGHKFPALWAVLTLIGNVIAWIIYMMVRPAATVGAEGKVVPKGTCPLCGTKLRSDFIACPGCGILLRSKCHNCGRALENDWSFCPYCTTQVVRLIAADNAQAEEAPSEDAPNADADAPSADE